MAERLTDKHTVSVYNNSNSEIYLGGNEEATKYIYKLAQLEDIMVKYGIESVEELDKKLQNLILIISTMNDYSITNCEELDIALKDFSFIKKQEKDREEIYRNMQQDRDTWKRACELAVLWIAQELKVLPKNIKKSEFEFEDEMIIEENTNYFYQQAKTEGNDEK